MGSSGAPRDEARSAFRSIWAVVARIPRGRVATYGQIARMAGLPGGARTAGWALAALPGALLIGGRAVPWHRVVNARGAISPRDRGSSGSWSRRQAERLRREGVAVSAEGGLELERYLWRGGGAVSPAGDRRRAAGAGRRRRSRGRSRPRA